MCKTLKEDLHLVVDSHHSYLTYTLYLGAVENQYLIFLQYIFFAVIDNTLFVGIGLGFWLGPCYCVIRYACLELILLNDRFINKLYNRSWMAKWMFSHAIFTSYILKIKNLSSYIFYDFALQWNKDIHMIMWFSINAERYTDYILYVFCMYNLAIS